MTSVETIHDRLGMLFQVYKILVGTMYNLENLSMLISRVMRIREQYPSTEAIRMTTVCVLMSLPFQLLAEILGVWMVH